MEYIDTSKLKHNPDAIKKHLVIEENITITKSKIRVIFLERWLKKDLAFIENNVRVLGFYCIIDSNGNYGVSFTPIYHTLEPSAVETVICSDGNLYTLLEFEANSVFISNNNMMVLDSILYPIFDEFYVKANIPWYMSYDNLADLLAESNIYADSNVGKNRILYEILTSMVGRSENKTEYYRHRSGKSKQLNWVALNNLYYSYKSTGAKLVGSYYGEGVSSAIINPEAEATKLEKHLMEG